MGVRINGGARRKERGKGGKRKEEKEGRAKS